MTRSRRHLIAGFGAGLSAIALGRSATADDWWNDSLGEPPADESEGSEPDAEATTESGEVETPEATDVPLEPEDEPTPAETSQEETPDAPDDDQDEPTAESSAVGATVGDSCAASNWGGSFITYAADRTMAYIFISPESNNCLPSTRYTFTFGNISVSVKSSESGTLTPGNDYLSRGLAMQTYADCQKPISLEVSWPGQSRTCRTTFQLTDGTCCLGKSGGACA
jgi:hypothetical protein